MSAMETKQIIQSIEKLYKKASLITIPKEEMKKEYVTFSLTIEESRNILKQCESNNVRFQRLLNKYLRNREGVTDLLIRPIQRLASIGLLLKEIKKNTFYCTLEKESLNKVIQMVHDILISMDSDKDRNDRMKKMFDIYQTIDKCPPELIRSQRKFILQFAAHELITKNQQHVVGSNLVFFLFDDILEIVKVRSKYQNQIKVFASTEKKEKPYKHFVMLPLFKLLNVFIFDDDSYSQGVFGLNIKDIKKENSNTIYCFQYSAFEVERLEDVLVAVCQTLSTHDGLKSEFLFEGLALYNLYLEPLPSTSSNIYETATEVVQKTCMLFGKVAKSKKKKRRSRSCSNIIDLQCRL